MSYRPRLAITLGDPTGIGPEIIVKALSQNTIFSRIRPLIIGDLFCLQRAAEICHSRLQWDLASPDLVLSSQNQLVPILQLPREKACFRPGKWSAATGKFSYQAVTLAVAMAQQNQVDAIVTAPICKEAWAAAGVPFAGHTELLAHLTHTQHYAMLFVGGPFRLLLVTIHKPLAQVARYLTKDRIIHTIRIGIQELQRRFGIFSPRVAVAGFNPHAGEGGLFGQEEKRVIAPAIRALKRDKHFQITGPYPADTLFVAAQKDSFDLIVCMYHDQGLIPFKMLAWNQGVNVTAGLPIIRTSPDHGTAFALAGTGQANAGSMMAAIQTAADMVKYAKNHTARKGLF